MCTPYYCNNEYYREQVHNIGGEIYEFGLEFVPGKSRKSIIEPLNNFFKNHKYDVVHIHSGSISILAYSAKVVKQNNIKKVIVHSHCSVEKIDLKNIILRNIANITFKKDVDVYCACSKEAAKLNLCQIL